MLRIKKIAIVVLCMYAAFLPIGAYLAYLYVENTSMVYDAPAGSIVAKAEKNADLYFPTQVDTNALLMLVTGLGGQNLSASTCFYDYSQRLLESVQEKSKQQVRSRLTDDGSRNGSPSAWTSCGRSRPNNWSCKVLVAVDSTIRSPL